MGERAMRLIERERPHSWTLLAAVLGLGAVLLLIVLVVAPLQGWTAWIMETQRSLHTGLAAALDRVRSGGVAAAAPLIALSFGYGVFHAAGPGHGKVVISTYLASHESRLVPALALTSLAALAQAATAIAAVHLAVTLLGLGLREARGGVAQLDALSFGLIAALGAALAFRAGLGAVRSLRGEAHGCAACGHDHHHHHHHGPATPSGGLIASLGVILAVGIRPCAGAVVVLLLAYAGDLRLVGIAAVLAMAVGTAITTGLLAALAVFARRQALKLAAVLPGGGGRLALGLDIVALVGGLLLLTLGLLLLQAALAPVPAHPFR
jgi:nickel/cobalt transporter (NicO) family protein